MKGFLKGDLATDKRGEIFHTIYRGEFTPSYCFKKDPKKPKIQSSASRFQTLLRLVLKNWCIAPWTAKNGPLFFTSQKWGRICWAPKSRARKNDGAARSFMEPGGRSHWLNDSGFTYIFEKILKKPYGFHTFLKDPRGGKKKRQQKSRQILPWKFAEKWHQLSKNAAKRCRIRSRVEATSTWV